MPTTSSQTSPRLSSGASQIGVAAWLACATVFVALGFLGASRTEEDVFYDYGLAAGSVVVFTILAGVTLLIASSIGRPLEVVGLKRFEWSWLWKALGLIVLLLALAAALDPLTHASEQQGLAPDAWRPDRAGAFAVNAVVASTLVPFGEELFFRGLGVRTLLPFGSVTAVAVTALAFGLAHGLVTALPVLVPFGLALGWIRWRSDSVWPGVIAHGSFNGLALLVLYLTLA